MRLAYALDRSGTSEAERRLSRLATPIAKYWTCKRAPTFIAEALECHGGNGFVEEHLMARLYREAPLNAIWEGTSNVICLDVIRALRRDPDAGEVFLNELREAHGANPGFDAFIKTVAKRLADLPYAENQARRTVELMAFALQASVLLRYSTTAVADAFCATRLDGDWGRAFGTLPPAIAAETIIDRARVVA